MAGQSHSPKRAAIIRERSGLRGDRLSRSLTVAARPSDDVYAANEVALALVGVMCPQAR